MKILFFDIETTGLDYNKHGIHQLSGQIVIDGQTKETFNFKMHPHQGALINLEALSVSGITKEDLLTYQTIEEAYKAFLALLDKYVNKFEKLDKFFLAGYNNAHFDNQFLRKWFEHNNDKYFGSWFWSNSLDVMVLATQYLMRDRFKMPSFQLKVVTERVGIKIDETRLHDALYDIELTRKIYDIVISK